MQTFECPLPLDTCIVRLEAHDGESTRFWRTEIVHRPKDGFSRVGIRQVPKWGIPYHLVLMRVELRPLGLERTRLLVRQRVNEWVWFVTLPLAALVMYSLGLWIQGDLVVNVYTLSVLSLLIAYVGMMAWLVISHARRNRAVLRALLDEATKTVGHS